MLLKEYEGTLPDRRLLPVLSNQKLNSYLKEIADLCGIEKNNTFHLAHHTFATTMTLASSSLTESKPQPQPLYTRRRPFSLQWKQPGIKSRMTRCNKPSKRAASACQRLVRRSSNNAVRDICSFSEKSCAATISNANYRYSASKSARRLPTNRSQTC